MIGSIFRSRVLRVALALGFAVALLAAAFLWRLESGPIPLAFLDQQIAAAVSDLAPDVTATVERTELARAGRGAALRVSGMKLARRDGTPLLSLPALTVRPSLTALLHGRVVITRVGVTDAELALTRTAEGAWLLGTNAGDTGVAILDLLSASQRGASASPRADDALPQIALTHTHVTIDDRRAGGTLDLTDGDLLLHPRPDGIDVTLSAGLDVVSAVPPVRGTLRLPVQVTAAVARGTDGALGQIDFTLTGGAGDVAPAGDTGSAAGPPFALAALDAKGVYLPAVETLRFERLAATVGGSRLALTATAILGATPLLALDGTVDALTMTALTRLWPADLATTVRTWLVEHTREGTLRKCRVQLGLHAAADEAAAAAVAASDRPAQKPNAYDVACDFDGVTANYLPPLAPIRAAKGAARLTAERLEVDVKSGDVGGCKVERATLTMNLTVDPARAEITADVNGTGAALLAFIDTPPLQLVTPLGITPQDLGGASRVHAELTLPIKRGLAARELGVQAQATLTAASLPPLVAGIGIANGALEVTTDGSGLVVKGTTNVTGLPEVTTPVTLALTIAPAKGGTRAAANDRQLTLALDGDGVALQGSARMVGNAFTQVTVERLRLAGNDLAGTIGRRADGGFTATLSGDRLDLAALLADPRLAAARADAGTAAAGYDVAVALGRVRASADTELHAVRGSLQGAGGSVTALTLTAGLPAGGTFDATLDGPTTARRILVTSDQGGALLKALGLPTELEGGKLTFTATTDERGPQAYLAGELALQDFRVVKAPILAKILSVGSLTSIAALIDRKKGLAVGEAKFPFRWTAPRLELLDVRAVGGIGLTGDGVIDRGANTCDLRGSIIPIYTLNTALGKVPVLNKIPLLGTLVGGDGKGLFGIAYQVSGTLPDPTVRVNALNTIAPNVLRSWFVDPFTKGQP